MNDKEIEKIRLFVHLHFLIIEAVKDIEKAKALALNDILIRALKHCGRKLRDELNKTKKDLRSSGIHIWIEDSESDVVSICIAKHGVKKRYGLKRATLNEGMSNTLDKLSEEFFNADYSNLISKQYVHTSTNKGFYH